MVARKGTGKEQSVLATTMLRNVRSRWRAGRRIVVALLRELADEAAYERHLARRGRTASRAEWRLFSDERLRGKYGRPKCC
jgi:hypothetical protein